MKSIQKETAIRLRKEGRTYSEILEEIPVAKSTLSQWFKSVQLATPQKQRITNKRKEAALRGALARHTARISEIQSLQENARVDIGAVSERELWLIGIALYWAEGSKQYDHAPSTGVVFNNSDARMITVFLKWLAQMGVPLSAINFELYIHEARKSEIITFKQWWSHHLKVPVTKFDRVYFKKGNPKTKRKNVDDLYHGLIRIKVNSSTSLNRKINGWIHAIVAQLGGRLMVGQETLNL